MNRYKLSPGDIIKIGRITLRIRDIKLSTNNLNTSALNDSNLSNTILKEMNNLKTEGAPFSISNTHTDKKSNNNLDKNVGVKEKIKPISLGKSSKKNEYNILTKIQKKNNVCRICYIEEEDSDNPLLQPCICSGSMKFIHLSCLKQWISTRSCVKIDKTENCSVYIIKEVECELCKTKFPDYIKHEGKLYALLDFSKEYENYLTLESLTLDKHKNKFIYVVSLIKNQKMKMGRGHDSDVLLSDISVSRVHCHLIVDNKKVFIEDNESKFGTLILIQYSNIKVIEGIPLNIQIGRTYIGCNIKKPFKLFNCCDVEERANIFCYYNQNEKHIQKHMNLIVRRDYNEEDDDSENNNKINNTFEQKYQINMNEKYNYNSMEIKDKDKISDNEYYALKYHKLNKNITKAMIDEDDNKNEKLISNGNDEENQEKEENKSNLENIENESEEENEEEMNKNEIEKKNNTIESFAEIIHDNVGDKKDDSKEDNKNSENNNQEDIESVLVSENNETMKKENYPTLE